MPEYASSLKRQAAASYGAEIVLTEDRKAAELKVSEFIEQGAYFIPPYDHPMVIEGQGTSCYEALEDLEKKPDYVFVPCGGGGLTFGTYLATQELNPSSKVIACEPKAADDAYRSLQSGTIQSFDHSPNTICDGVMTLKIGEINFEFIKKIHDLILVDEEQITYWTQWLHHLLKVNIEPSYWRERF